MKTTAFGREAPFYLTRTELSLSKSEPELFTSTASSPLTTARSGGFPRSPACLTFHVVAMWDHLKLSNLRDFVMQWALTPFIARSRPV